MRNLVINLNTAFFFLCDSMPFSMWGKNVRLLYGFSNAFFTVVNQYLMDTLLRVPSMTFTTGNRFKMYKTVSVEDSL